MTKIKFKPGDIIISDQQIVLIIGYFEDSFYEGLIDFTTFGRGHIGRVDSEYNLATPEEIEERKSRIL